MSFAFGIFDSFDLGDATPGAVLTNRLDLAVAAEAAGIDHYHVTEHHGTPLSVCPSPNLFLAALSQRTSTMRIGALVNVLPIYDPLRLAEEIAVLDQLCAGRLDLGVGRGVSPYELGYFGVSDEDSRALFTETLGVVTAALATGRMNHRGERLRDYDVELSVRPVQLPHPPLWYASSNAGTAAWAGTNDVNFVGRWNDGSFTSTAETFWNAWESRPTRAGGPPRIGVAATVHIGATDEEALDRYHKAHAVYARQLTKLWHDHDDHRVDAMADAEAGLRRGTALVGSPHTVRDRVLEQVERAEVNYVEATLAFGDLTPAEASANLQAFTEVVAPAVRAATAGREHVRDAR
ncbi:LLM class flavin-dependent oxidoreductase [Pseudonocardia xinjiangensis]|uniref:LLM class flavin-dependent oxidoreductase n=1 Tax=Pseudonocardia xinjiangensis TaxID=75289 RepID=UPI003D8E626B